MPAKRRRRFLEILAQAAIAARASFGAPAPASCVRTTLPAPMRLPRWPIIWRALAEASRARARPLSPSPNGRPPMSRSSPPDLRSSRPSRGRRLGLHPALRSRSPRLGQALALRRARCLTRVRCRKRAHFRKSSIPSQYVLRRRPRRCCSHLKSSKRCSVASPRRCSLLSLMTSVQPTSVQSRPARCFPPPESRPRGELRQRPARRSARLRPRVLRPHHAGL